MGRVRLDHRHLFVAGTLALVAGCVSGTPTTPGGSASAPAASPSGSPSPGSSASPSASTAPSGTPSAAASPLPTGSFQGHVYDDQLNNAPDGSQVIVHSLDPMHPFDSTVTTAGGVYAVPNAPLGIELQITATNTNWTRRTRVEVVRPNNLNLSNRNVFNFGGPSSTVDPIGQNYFISDRPEIESVSPIDQSTDQPANQMTFKLTLSAALDATNQGRLAAAFNILPNNQQALSNTTALPAPTVASGVTGLNAGSTPASTAPYAYRQNSAFQDVTFSTFQWSADNRTATFTLNAPVKTDSQTEAQYAFVLLQADSNPIVNQVGEPLGMKSYAFGATVQGDILANSILMSSLSLQGNSEALTRQQRWYQTHQSVTTFTVSRDEAPPALSSVLARRNYVDANGNTNDRVELTFSKPMVAYPNISGSDLLSLNNYVLATGKAQADVDALGLHDNGTASQINPGASYNDVRTALDSTSGMVINVQGASTTDSSGSTKFSIKLGLANPSLVVINLPAGSLPSGDNFIRVLVGSDGGLNTGTGKVVTDAAGNTIATNGNTKSGPIQ